MGWVVGHIRSGRGRYGGSIYVTTTELDGSGSFLAEGGSSDSGTGGGGGRVAIYANKAMNFTNFSGVSVAPGQGGTRGSIVFVSQPVRPIAPSSGTVSYTQSLPVNVTITGPAGIPAPSGSVTLTAGPYPIGQLEVVGRVATPITRASEFGRDCFCRASWYL